MRNHFLRTVGGSATVAGPSDPWELTNMLDPLNSPQPFNWFAGRWPTAGDTVQWMSADGTKLFWINGYQSGVIRSAELSTAWDPQTLDLDNVTTSSGIHTTKRIYGLTLKPDGTRLYVTTYDGDIYEHSLSTAWDLTTLSTTATNSFDASAYATAGLKNLKFKPDGTMMFFVHKAATSPYLIDSVQSFTLGTAWSLGGTITHEESFQVQSEETNPTAVDFKSDGTEMYITGGSGDTVDQWTLSTAWDISTAGSHKKWSSSFPSAFHSTITYPNSICVSSDGTKVFVGHAQVSFLTIARFGTAYDASTISMSFPTNGWFKDSNVLEGTGIYLKSDGTKMYIANHQEKVHEYSLSTAWDITSASHDYQLSIATYFADIQGLFFKSDGTKMYTCDVSRKNIEEFALSTAWDLSTTSWTRSLDVSSTVEKPYGLYFKPDGEELYMVDQRYFRIYKYTLSTAWDISTASYDSYESFASIDGDTFSWSADRPMDLFFKDDGTVLFLTSSHNSGTHAGPHRLFEFSLSTAWDLSTASFERKVIAPISRGTASGASIFIGDDGTQLYYTSGTVTRGVLSYNL